MSRHLLSLEKAAKELKYAKIAGQLVFQEVPGAYELWHWAKAKPIPGRLFKKISTIGHDYMTISKTFKYDQRLK